MSVQGKVSASLFLCMLAHVPRNLDESTPQRYSLLSFSQRLKVAVDVACCLLADTKSGSTRVELDTASKPAPSFKADVYAFGVILMELLTKEMPADIISGQSGAVDLTDWVRLCDREGRRMDCIDRDIAGGDEPTKAMDDLLAILLRCILPLNKRPNIRQVFGDLCSISV
uniref:Protein kinase domain-containing protein n=1 Tax=Salix viminalis TaxID=40686 RepID=A0A6N2MAQ9_SALVM